MLAMAGVLAGYLELVLPRQKPPQDLHIVITPELQERDRYLVENVAVCGDCHSERDWSKYGGPVKKPLGAGRGCVSRELLLTGVLPHENRWSGLAIRTEDCFLIFVCTQYHSGCSYRHRWLD
jgi:hypothetical protein